MSGSMSAGVSFMAFIVFWQALTATPLFSASAMRCLTRRVGLEHVDARAVGDELDLDAFAADAVAQVGHVVEDHVPARRVVVGDLEQGAVLRRAAAGCACARDDERQGGGEHGAAGEEEGTFEGMVMSGLLYG